MMTRPSADDRFNGGRAPAPSQTVTRERRLLTVVVVCAALLSVTGLALRSTSPSTGSGATMREAVSDLVSPESTRPDSAPVERWPDVSQGGYTAVIVAQVADCDGNLGVFGLLDRPSIAIRIPHRLLLVEGMARDTLGLRQRLPASLQHARMAILSSAQRAVLRQLGHLATPSLLLFDRERQLRYAGATPPGPVERTVQLAVITQLVSNLPQPATP